MNNLNAAFQSLPQNVREWLADEQVALAIDEINQKLNLDEENGLDYVIPHLVLRLCVQDLEPRYFINELSHWLNIGFDSAKTLTKEIEEKILKPIEAPLKIDVGVDLKLLYFASASSSSLRSFNKTIEAEAISSVVRPSAGEIATPQFFAEAKKIEVRDDNKNVIARSGGDEAIFSPEGPSASNSSTLLATKIAADTTSVSPRNNAPIKPVQPVISSHPAIQPSSPPAKPFLLHEEKSNHPGQTASGSSFSYKPSISNTPSPPPPPPKVNVQLPPPPIIKRVVHYSRFLTRIMNNESGIKSNENKGELKIPKSRWFV